MPKMHVFKKYAYEKGTLAVCKNCGKTYDTMAKREDVCKAKSVIEYGGD